MVFDTIRPSFQVRTRKKPWQFIFKKNMFDTWHFDTAKRDFWFENFKVVRNRVGNSQKYLFDGHVAIENKFLNDKNFKRAVKNRGYMEVVVRQHKGSAKLVEANALYVRLRVFASNLTYTMEVEPGMSGPLATIRGKCERVSGLQTAHKTPKFNHDNHVVETQATKSASNSDRGSIGLFVQELTEDIADSLGLDDANGALIAKIKKTGPGDKAGLQSGDVIVRIDGEKVWNTQDFLRIMAKTTAYTTANVEVLRYGKVKKLSVTLGRLERTEDEKFAEKMNQNLSESELCSLATYYTDNGKAWFKGGENFRFSEEAKARGLDCGVKNNVKFAKNDFIPKRLNSKKADAEALYCYDGDRGIAFMHRAFSMSNCGGGASYRISETDFEKVKASQLNIPTSVAPSSNSASSAELTAAQRKAERLEAELAALQAEQQQEEQRISSDTQIPLITASSRRDGETNALISGKVTDNVEVAEVTINGEPVRLSSNGSFETSFYVPRSGKTIEIVAFDSKGNKATKSIKLERGAIQQATGPVFANLNPSGKRVSQNKDALALIIGVSDYERTPAKAAYADKDAQTFYDYAMLKLGIPASNIKELVNTNADRVDVRLAIKDWIARTTKQGRSDVYVFFAGHGLADQTGKEMFLLPHDGEPRLLEDTAISRERLFSDIAAANPRSVTVFLDTCYSGTTRGTDMLVASRPIAIRAKQQNIPDGFTVFTAAGGDQTAKPLEEAKHGMFSYFLMKGMEGDADSNRDNQITAAELHEYVEQNVVQQSGGSQVPELQGDAGRVLVRFQ